ncbi:MAG: ATP-binding cassette domain-containing protein, partial [Chloroflexota bacterium]
EWFERFLLERQLTVLIASHDRWMLDRVTGRTLSFERGTVVEYRGAYSRYVRQRAERDASLARAADRQAEEIARTEDFIRRYGAGQRSKEARGRAKKLARVERIEGPERAARHGWRLEAAHLASDVVVDTTPLAVGHERGVPVLRTPALRVERDARIAVVGPNGAGKTTLVRTLVGDLPPLEGYVSSAPTARVGFLAQAQAELMGDETALDALRSASALTEQEARDLLARFLFRGEDVFRAVGVLSGGERSRLALARLAARQANLLVLDEPTNHLDVAAREALEAVLADFDGALVLVSHDRYFIDRLASEVWLVERGELRRHEGNWTSLQRERDLQARRRPGDVASGRDASRARSLAPAPRAGTGRDVRRRPATAPVARDRALPSTSPGRRRARAPEVEALEGRIAEKEQAGRPTRSARGVPSRGRTRGPSREVQALEGRIAAMEQKLKEHDGRIAEVAQSGNYMDTRRVGEEHATLERALRELYDEWAQRSEAE